MQLIQKVGILLFAIYFVMMIDCRFVVIFFFDIFCSFFLYPCYFLCVRSSVVEAIIARLSLETGPHFGNRGTDSNDDHSDSHGHGAWTDSGEEEDGLLKSPEHFDDDDDES